MATHSTLRIKGNLSKIKYLNSCLDRALEKVKFLQNEILEAEIHGNLLNEIDALEKIKNNVQNKSVRKTKKAFRCVKCLQAKRIRHSYNFQGCYCKDCHLTSRKANYAKTRNKTINKVKTYRKVHRKKLNEYACNYVKRRKSEDPLFKVASTLRNRIRNAIKYKKFTRVNKPMEHLGCSIEEAKIHIEKQFKPEMTWDNHGVFGWHIDHIIPLSSAKTKEELYPLFHYTNLQPLWAKDNLSKSNKMPLNKKGTN